MLLLFMVHFFSYAQNQQRRWFHNSKEVDMTVNPPTVSTTTSAVPPYYPVDYETSHQSTTNGLSDKNNNRTFNINGSKLYAPNLSIPATVMPIASGSDFHNIGPEIVVCPLPGSCDSFYFFYSHDYKHGEDCTDYDLSYYLIDKNNLTDANIINIESEIGQVYHFKTAGKVFYCVCGEQHCPFVIG